MAALGDQNVDEADAGGMDAQSHFARSWGARIARDQAE